MENGDIQNDAKPNRSARPSSRPAPGAIAGRGLVGWGQFCGKVRADAAFCEPERLRKFNRFRARFLLASRFRGVVADHYDQNRLDGYSAGIGLLLAYSAAEGLVNALGQRRITWQFADPAIAARLRPLFARARNSGFEVFSDPARRLWLEEFCANRTDDIWGAATALRVLVAHGFFTPTGVDALTKRGVAAIDDLRLLLLVRAELQFNEWLAERTAAAEPPTSTLSP